MENKEVRVTSDVDRKGPRASEDSESQIIGAKSLGVKRIEALSSQFRTFDRAILFLGIFLVAYAYGLDGTLRYTYQPNATADLGQHSLLATVTVVRAVIAAAIQPAAAKIADVFGRAEVIMISILFYVIGTIVESTAQNVGAFAGGAILYQIGYTIIILMMEILIADLTSLRSRLFFSYIPASPFIINTWVSGDVAQSTLDGTTWRWGIGMWAIIFPACCIPLLISLYITGRRAKRAGDLTAFKTPFQSLGFTQLASQLFWQLDVIGIFLILAVFALILVPFTLAGGYSESWKAAKTIVPLVIGICLAPVFIIWERYAKHPMIPFPLLKDRGVWGALGVAVMLNTAWYLQGDYLYTVLVVAFNESIKSATRIASLYSFTSVLMGIGVGIVVRFVKYLKPFIVVGTCLFTVAFGLLIHFRGGGGGSSHSGIIGAQVLLGLAGGLFPYTAQASIQAATKHEHVAVITALYLATYNIGSALGNTISGAIWTQLLPKKLSENLATVTSNTTLAVTTYGDPFSFALAYGMETPERQAVVAAYRDTQRLLCITGICLSLPLIAFGLCTRNPKLGKAQSLEQAEQFDKWSNPEVTGSEKKRWFGIF